MTRQSARQNLRKIRICKLTWPKISDMTPAERQRLSRISETNMAVTFIKKCMR